MDFAAGKHVSFRKMRNSRLILRNKKVASNKNRKLYEGHSHSHSSIIA